MSGYNSFGFWNELILCDKNSKIVKRYKYKKEDIDQEENFILKNNKIKLKDVKKLISNENFWFIKYIEIEEI